MSIFPPPFANQMEKIALLLGNLINWPNLNAKHNPTNLRQIILHWPFEGHPRCIRSRPSHKITSNQMQLNCVTATAGAYNYPLFSSTLGRTLPWLILSCDPAMCAVRIGKVPGYQKVDCPVGRRWIAREQGGGVSLSAAAADIIQLLRHFPAFQCYLKLHLANNMLLTDLSLLPLFRFFVSACWSLTSVVTNLATYWSLVEFLNLLFAIRWI